MSCLPAAANCRSTTCAGYALEVNQEGRGVIGISAQLPNSFLVIGQHETLDRLMARAKEELNMRVHLRKNDSQWPPVHTPIVWQRQIPNRAAERMHTLPVALALPRPKIFSLVTGTYGYTPVNARELMVDWVDHPQRLWDAIYETLISGVTTILHVGPGPNIVPATYKRLFGRREQPNTGEPQLAGVIDGGPPAMAAANAASANGPASRALYRAHRAGGLALGQWPTLARSASERNRRHLRNTLARASGLVNLRQLVHAASCRYDEQLAPYRHKLFHVLPSSAGREASGANFSGFNSTRLSSPSSDKTSSKSPTPRICPCSKRPLFHFRLPLATSTHSRIPPRGHRRGHRGRPHS